MPNPRRSQSDLCQKYFYLTFILLCIVKESCGKDQYFFSENLKTWQKDDQEIDNQQNSEQVSDRRTYQQQQQDRYRQRQRQRQIQAWTEHPDYKDKNYKWQQTQRRPKQQENEQENNKMPTQSQLSEQCQPCFYIQLNQQCRSGQLQEPNPHPFTLHVSTHPHMDSFWIYNFNTYQDSKQQDKQPVYKYFSKNHMVPAQEIFDNVLEVLAKSRRLRTAGGERSQQARRSFFTSEVGFFKHWFTHLNQQKQKLVKELLNTQYWEILGGDLVEHDEACAYYQDIIQNFQLGLSFLKQRLNYIPKIGFSGGSLGHSQSTAAILAHLGMQGLLVQNSDEHLISNNKSQFIWHAKSANNLTYGTIPTHIRWRPHSYEDQFTYYTEQEAPLCEQKQEFISLIRKQNRYLKKVMRSNHVMRYFGHHFQNFGNYQFDIIESFMEQLVREKCQNVIALYTNPTEYFKILLGTVFANQKPIQQRQQDLFPSWDYRSGQYQAGYFTTYPRFKKLVRDLSRFLHISRKVFFLSTLRKQSKTTTPIIQSYQLLEQYAQLVATLQHHNGVSGTSKYQILDQYEQKALKYVKKIQNKIFIGFFADWFGLYSQNQLLMCGVFTDCKVPDKVKNGVGLYLKIFNSGTRVNVNPIVIHLPYNRFYKPQNQSYQYQIICPCRKLTCSCDLYLYIQVPTFLQLHLIWTLKPQKNLYFLEQLSKEYVDTEYKISYTDYKIRLNSDQQSKILEIGYKKIPAWETKRSYENIDQFAKKSQYVSSIRSGKYGLANDPEQMADVSKIKKVYVVKTQKLIKVIVEWMRQGMKTVIQSNNIIPYSWKVQTLSAPQIETPQDYYLTIQSKIENNINFHTDSNGWLITHRRIFSHQDYRANFPEDGKDNINGNTYPMTAFTYIEDDLMRLIVNTDRPQGVVCVKEGAIWVNIDRVTQDDNNNLNQEAYRSQYSKFVHYVTLQEGKSSTKNYSHRIIQQLYDQPVLIQINLLEQNQRVSPMSFNIDNSHLLVSQIEHTKFWIRPRNDSSAIFRIQNIHDEKDITVNLFQDNTATFLNNYFGKNIKFEDIREMSLGANMQYQQFIDNKWVWEGKLRYKKENQIFNKIFAQKITLRPLQIRTFRLQSPIIHPYQTPTQQPSATPIAEYTVNRPNPPQRSIDQQKTEYILKRFLYEGDHCKDEVPVLYKQSLKDLQVDYRDQEQILRLRDFSVREEFQDWVEDDVGMGLDVEADQWLGDHANMQTIQKKIIPTQKQLKDLEAKIRLYNFMSREQKNIYFQNKLNHIQKYFRKIK